mgnify:CR=1 FL=1
MERPWRLFYSYVSILILLEVPLQQLEKEQKKREEGGFNPYFTGSTTSTKSLLEVYYQELKSFNPYFTGSTTSTTHVSCISVTENSFNPYFTGSTTSTDNSPGDLISFKGFQSLFYWKYHFNLQQLRRSARLVSVSILILLEVPLQQLLFVRIG